MRKRKDQPLTRAHTVRTIPLVASEPVEHRVPPPASADPKLVEVASGLLPPSAEPRAASWYSWSVIEQGPYPDEWTTPEIDGLAVPSTAAMASTEAHGPQGRSDPVVLGRARIVHVPLADGEVTTAEAAGWLPDRPAPPPASWVRAVAGFVERAHEASRVDPRASSGAAAWPLSPAQPGATDEAGEVARVHAPRPHPSTAVWPPPGLNLAAVRDAMAQHPSAAARSSAADDPEPPPAEVAGDVAETVAETDAATAPEVDRVDTGGTTAEPALTEPAPAEPALAEPAPAEPAPTEPALTEPALAERAPAETRQPEQPRPRSWPRDHAPREPDPREPVRRGPVTAPTAAGPNDVVARIERGASLAMNEEQLRSFAQRALRRLLPDGTTTWLTLDAEENLQVHLTTGDDGRPAGASRCAVRERRMCPAIVAEQVQRFDRSDELDACPNLVTDDGPTCAALCVPVLAPGPLQGVLFIRTSVGEPCGDDTAAVVQHTVDAVAARLRELRSLDR